MQSTIPRLLRVLPVAALLLAVGAQAVMMQSVNIDRQAGSGFAMFSSVDHAGSRFVLAETVLGDTVVSLPLPSALNDEIDELLIQPTDRTALQFAELLRDRRWDIADTEVGVDGDDQLASVTVTVRGLTADGRTLGSQVLAQASTP